MSNNIQELRRVAIDMTEGMNIIVENYNALISIEEKVINLQKDINNIYKNQVIYGPKSP